MDRSMSSAGRAGTAFFLALAVAACSGGGDGNPAADAATSPRAEAVSQGEPAKIPATREMLQQAYACRGLMSAAWAAVQVIPETERPAGLADLTVADSSVWNGRIGSLDASAIPEEEVNTMLAQGTRVLATREALERELPAIAECRKAAADF
ncbi:hypothetical protein LY632_13545 [Erythrobacter sp. SDW2]|uniref:hypothetical protein n=1 Tax=Erythrobacter sp. SDW2 TaxID=2907154 RepID=UPI001F374216|nr:hypothetical protein [Erythrobacter sp. SDW2]UIP06689.1 hypothetical protein LY632_13545 [Erythrobacter sp. SDW2]